jgi:hypothetical protein
LARRIEQYADDPSLCEREGRAARELFDRRFTKPRAVKRLISVIESMGS